MVSQSFFFFFFIGKTMSERKTIWSKGSRKKRNGGGDPCALRKCNFLLGKNQKCLECSRKNNKYIWNIARVSAKTWFILFISWNNEIYTKYLSFTTRYFFLLQNNPFQAFLVSEAYTFMHEERKKNTFLFICPLKM